MSNSKIINNQPGPPSDVERIKDESNYLRGTLEQSFLDRTSAGISDDDNRLMKFHGSYMQDDRDLRAERQKQKLEPAYQFMVRIRAAGGVVTPEQWLTIDKLAENYASGNIRLTTRQAIQLHGILKWNMKKSLQEMNESLLDSLAACGDVNRNVMLNPNPYQSKVHSEVYEWATKLREHLSPQTKAYHEIWLDGEKVISTDEEQEPIYGKLYLPRKFKIGIAVPPSNDIDVYSQDLGFIAILDDNQQLKGFNVTVGGGMGMTHGDSETYPQIGKLIGFITPDEIIEVAEKIITIQRDFGNRSVRKNARFKYTIDARGIDWLKAELHERLGFELKSPELFHFNHNGDRYGWVQGDDKAWHYTLFIQNGRIIDKENHPLMSGLKEIARVHKGDFRVTANQNLIIANIQESEKKQIEQLLTQFKLDAGEEYSALKRNSMACVAFPTCGLAMAESERYLPSLLKKLDKILDEAGLLEEEITIRMSGCPNGCSRPALAEIALIGKGPGKYNLYLGGGFAGERLNKLYRENIEEKQILAELTPLFHEYAKERTEGEHFGDFLIRKDHIQAVDNGLDFHA